ncbi:MAG: 6-phosphofructokinase [Chloroflexi bacterium RBG_16_48_8]|nr:MAG: 6-phosphofructokinase [Chloroflexi bacterium RBG_16_48_8]
MRRIAILSSGGDAPGINPCIRAAVRTALDMGVEVIGIQEGFDGLVRGEMIPLKARDVGGILQRGGTFLRTARCPEFLEVKTQRKALRELNESDIDGLIVIGGDGSLRGAHALAILGFPVVGAPASIDNDIWGTDMSIGVDTAINTIMHAIDKLRDTASSHERAFLIETMGRNCGYLALNAGVVCGAEMILIPEKEVSMEEIVQMVAGAYDRGKSHCIIVVAEGSSLKVHDVAEYLRINEVGFETRVTILGHIPRGGSPSAFDRMLATRMGVKAVEVLKAGETDLMIGLSGRDIITVPLIDVVKQSRKPNLELLDMARTLAK